MMITCVSDLATQQVDKPVVAMDGTMAEALSAIGDHVDTTGMRCVGMVVAPEAEVAFAQNLPDFVHLEDASSLDEIVAKAPEIVVLGPSALLGSVVTEGVVRRLLDALPGVRIVCATGIRTDLELW